MKSSITSLKEKLSKLNNNKKIVAVKSWLQLLMVVFVIGALIVHRGVNGWGGSASIDNGSSTVLNRPTTTEESSGKDVSINKDSSPTNGGQSVKKKDIKSNSLCTKEYLKYPPQTYPVSFLEVGEKSVVPGFDGIRYHCKPDSLGNVSYFPDIPGAGDIVYEGIGQKLTEPSRSGSQMSDEEYNSLKAEYDRARDERIQSCLRYLGSQGAGGSSAAQMCYTIE